MFHNSLPLRSIAGGLFIPTVLILILQTATSKVFTMSERDLTVPKLETIPFLIGDWTAIGEDNLERETALYLKPDSYVLRDYRSESKSSTINLFVTYYKSLKNVYGPHSPRFCLPGSGWLIRSSEIAVIPVPGRPEGVSVNGYFLDKDGHQIFVIYWYQNNRNVWAAEYEEKLRLLSDMVRYRRSDVSLIRIVAPIEERSVDRARRNTLDFAKIIFPRLEALFGALDR